MIFPSPLEEGRLIRRYKRFFVDIETSDGSVLVAHCPNTGSMKNCLADGARVWFTRNNDPRRKLKATLEILETPQGRLASVNTARANELVEEALRAGVIRELNGFDRLRREVRFGQENSRADFCLSFAEQQVFVEVKSVTLGFPETDVAAFPDAVTERGAKHLRELTALAQAGERAVLLYSVALSDVTAVRAAGEIDPRYAQTLREAIQSGVEVLAYAVKFDVQHNQLRLARPVRFLD